MEHVKFEVPATVVRAAVTFQAVNDVRYYLNGICFSGKNLIATDGYTMFVAELDKPVSESELIVKLTDKVPAKANSVEFSTETSIATCKDINEKIIKVIYFELIDGKFPNWQRVVPQGKTVKINRIGFKPEYILKVQAAAKILNNRWVQVNASFYGESKAIKFDICSPLYKCFALVMPARM